MKIVRVTMQASVLVAVTLFVGACHIGLGDWSWAHYERTVELQQAMAEGGTLAVSTASGHIEVAGHVVDAVRVVATIRGQAGTEEEAQEIAEETEIRFEPAGERLSIRADTPKLGHGRSVSISYDIAVPQRASVECGSASGAIHVVGLEGNVHASTASGSVTCEDIRGGDVDMGSASGAVRLTNGLDLGTCDLHSVSGRAQAEQVQAGQIRLGSTSGPVDLTDAKAKSIEMRGTSGHIVGREIDCSRLSAESASGRVSIEFTPTAPGDVAASASSISGSVTVVAPKDFAGRVEMSTTSGSVTSDLPVTVQGRMTTKHLTGSVGEGDGSLTLRTTSGSVHLR